MYLFTICVMLPFVSTLTGLARKISFRHCQAAQNWDQSEGAVVVFLGLNKLVYIATAESWCCSKSIINSSRELHVSSLSVTVSIWEGRESRSSLSICIAQDFCVWVCIESLHKLGKTNFWEEQNNLLSFDSLSEILSLLLWESILSRTLKGASVYSDSHAVQGCSSSWRGSEGNSSWSYLSHHPEAESHEPYCCADSFPYLHILRFQPKNGASTVGRSSHTN